LPVVPFDDKGNMQEYPWRPKEWREVGSFDSGMELVGISRGQSAVRFRLKADDGTIYPTFLHDMEYIMHSPEGIANGKVPTARWVFVKRGQNYGIALEKRLTADAS